jgi:hypothetical protein
MAFLSMLEKKNNEFLQWLWQKILSQILSFTFKLLGKAF